MSPLVLGLLVNLPLIVATAVTAVVWRTIQRRLHFFVAATLSLFGLQSVIAPVSIGVFLPNGGGLTLAVVNEAFTQSVLAASIGIFIIGIPYLWWLAGPFRKPLNNGLDIQKPKDAAPTVPTKA